MVDQGPLTSVPSSSLSYPDRDKGEWLSSRPWGFYFSDPQIKPRIFRLYFSILILPGCTN